MQKWPLGFCFFVLFCFLSPVSPQEPFLIGVFFFPLRVHSGIMGLSEGHRTEFLSSKSSLYRSHKLNFFQADSKKEENLVQRGLHPHEWESHLPPPNTITLGARIPTHIYEKRQKNNLGLSMDRGLLASNSEQRRSLARLRDEAIGHSLLLKDRKKNFLQAKSVGEMGKILLCSHVSLAGCSGIYLQVAGM